MYGYTCIRTYFRFFNNKYNNTVTYTTEECLLNPNRNPGLSRAQIERLLRRYLNVEVIIWLGKGVPAKTNAEQVAKIRRILEELSLEIATPAEAREMLKLKGGDLVGF